MNKLFTKIAGLSLGLAMAIGVGVAVGSKEAKVASAAATSYTITFNGNNSESTSISTSTTAASITGSSAYVTGNVATATKAYGATSSGVKLGTSSAAGTLKINLSASGQVTPTSVVVNAKLYNSSKAATLGFNGSTKQSVTADYSDITFNYTTAITYIQIDVTKYVWVKSVTVNYNSGSTKLTTPSPSYDDITKKVSWSVEHASSYQVKVDNGSYATGTSPYDVSGLTTGVSHTIYVIAKGDGTNYTDSDAGQTSFTPTAPAVYTSVSVSGGNLVGTDKGSAYIQCNGTAQGTNIPASPSFTWYVTATNSYGTTTTVTDKASIDSTGKVTFLDNCTVYVWALAPDGSVHNTSGYEAVASGLVSPKGSEDNPYTVSEARGIATSTSNNTHVTGIIYEVSSYNSTYKSITYWISDDGTGSSSSKDGLQIYSGKGLNGADFSGTSDLTVGSTVVVQGDLKIYQSTTYELDKNSVIKSITLPKELSSIAVKTAPTKTAYKANENFAPAGLVITLTYSDSTTEDVAYSDIPGSFSFSPSVITAAGDVTITFREKTCTQAVTLITVTNVTSVASAPTEVYKDGSIDPADVVLNVTYSDSSVGTVTPDSVTCDTSSTGPATATATYNAATGTKSATFDVTVKNAPVYDYITDEIVHSDLTATGTSYSNFSNLSKTSEAIYKGNTSLQDSTKIGFRSGTTSGQSQHSGIVTTTSGGNIYQVSVTEFDHATRILDVYGSDTAYSDPNDLYNDSKGTKLGSLTQASQSLTVTGDYAYVGVRSNDGLIKVSSIHFVWKVEGAADPLIENPTLSTGSAATVSVGKSIPLTITTNPVDSDEKLTVTSDDPECVTVTGSDRNYTISAVAVGSATVTVAGVKGVYQSSVVITVVQGQKTYEDKILTTTSLGLAASYADSDGSHTYEDVEYVTSKVCKSGGFQFQKDNGSLYNNEELYGTSNIKSITLVMNAGNKNQPVVYEGTTAEPSSSLSPLTTFSTTGVNTYVFSSGKPFFKIGASASGAVNIDTIIIELEDSSNSVLEEARLAALSILTDLSGNCGDGGSGMVTQSEWNQLNSNLSELDLSDDAKALLKNAERILIGNLSQGGAEIENAMAHYDACVAKFGYTPFSDITSVQSSGRVNLIQAVTKNSGTSIAIIAISAVSLAAVGGYFLFRKKKEN